MVVPQSIFWSQNGNGCKQNFSPVRRWSLGGLERIEIQSRLISFVQYVRLGETCCNMMKGQLQSMHGHKTTTIHKI
eukprot:scaffold100372_cov30-Attheya_sp.AAC.1